MLNPPVKGKIQGLFKAFDCLENSFQGKFNFQGLFKTALYIQVLFKPVRSLFNIKNCDYFLIHQLKRVLGANKSRLIEMALLSTHNMVLVEK